MRLPENLRDHTNEIRFFVAYPVLPVPHPTHIKPNKTKMIQNALPGTSPPSPLPSSSSRRCASKCATNPKSNSISTNHQKTLPPPPFIQPTNQIRRVVTLMMTSISILMTLRSCYTFSVSSETDFLRPLFPLGASCRRTLLPPSATTTTCLCEKMPFSSSSL